jgi:hypothetical protein
MCGPVKDVCEHSCDPSGLVTGHLFTDIKLFYDAASIIEVT